jgi:hypothetical protein
MPFLRQSTATLIQIGPFVASSDGVTPETALTFATGFLNLYQAGSNAAIDLSSRTVAHISQGVYALSLLASDLAVAGPLLIHARAASTQPQAYRADVLAQTSYDAMMAGAALPANVTQVNASAQAAQNLGSGALGIQNVTVGNGSTTTLVATNLTQAIGSFYNGRTLLFLTGALAGQAQTITGYNGSTKQLTVNPLTGAPSPNDTAIII